MRSVAAALAGLFLCLPLASTLAETPQMAGEQLFVPPPKGWKVGFHERKGEVEVTEVLPPDQTVQDWTEMLTVEVLSGRPDKKAEDVIKEQLGEIQKACEDVGAGPASPGTENGYETSMRAIACTKSKQWGRGELSLFKVVRGKDRTYVVSRSWRGEPYEKSKIPVPPETTKEWLAFMQQVMLCDTRDPTHPCPVGPGGAGGAPAARK